MSDDAGAPDRDPVQTGTPDPTDADTLDLDRIAAELDAVAVALDRLDDGSYWTDEVTGRTIDDALLAADPTRRRAD